MDRSGGGGGSSSGTESGQGFKVRLDFRAWEKQLQFEPWNLVENQRAKGERDGSDLDKVKVTQQGSRGVSDSSWLP